MIQNVVNKALPLANNPGTIAAFLEYLHSPDECRFRVGDAVTFEKESGREWPMLILGIRGEDVDLMCYDGMPHLIQAKLAELAALRVVLITEESDETVEMYRDLVGLETQR
jgi:hypothetical protein